MKVYTFKPYIPDKALDYLRDVLKSGCLAGTCDRYVTKFEQLLAQYLNVKHVVATSSGTSALHVALKALDVGPGDEVIVPAFTFIATASAVLHSNAIPIFVDIELDTLGIDPVDLEKRISDRTKAIIVVHIGGVPAKIDEILKIARERGVYVIEDCAQALGAEVNGKKVGTFGIISAFSFYPTKTITTGEGGAVATNDDKLAERARLLVNHGERSRYYSEVLGYNYRMSEVQAAIGLAQLEIIDRLVETRRRFAKTFIEEVESTLSDYVQFQRVPPSVNPSWNLIQILLNVEKIGKSRDYVLQKLHEAGLKVFTVAYPRPLYENPVFKTLVGHGRGCPWTCKFYDRPIRYDRLPNCEYVCSRVLTLLVSPTFTEEDAVDIARTFIKVIRDIKGGA